MRSIWCATGVQVRNLAWTLVPASQTPSQCSQPMPTPDSASLEAARAQLAEAQRRRHFGAGCIEFAKRRSGQDARQRPWMSCGGRWRRKQRGQIIMLIEFVLNGIRQRVDTRPGENFLEVLRERCGITSLKDGCSPQGQCGCCLALVDGKPKTTCAMPARRGRRQAHRHARRPADAPSASRSPTASPPPPACSAGSASPASRCAPRRSPTATPRRRARRSPAPSTCTCAVAPAT